MRIHEKIIKTNTIKKIINWAEPKTLGNKTLSNYDKLQKMWPTVFMLSTVGVAQTGVIMTTDEIPKKRRIPLALNNVITCVMAFFGGLLTDKYTDKLKDKFIQRAGIVIKDSKQTVIINGIKTAIPVLASALLYKYIGQVIATPLTDKVNKVLVKNGLVNYSDNK